MRKSIPGILITLCLSFLFSTTTNAQKKITRDVIGKLVERSRSANPNIKSEAPNTDQVEEKSRGTCTIYFPNYTGYYVNIYVDGYYRGQVAPWGSGTIYVASGYTTIYAISAGGTREWSDSGNCEGTFRFRFLPPHL